MRGNKIMYFNGDIIITDPCYIMNDANTKEMPKDYEKTRPKDSDFFTQGIIRNGTMISLPHYYSDAIIKNPSEWTAHDKELVKSSKRRVEMLLEKGYSATPHIPMKSKLYEKEWNAFLEADYQWRLPYMSDWERSEYGRNMSVLGINNCMVSTTYYGDWGCHVFDLKSNESIGEFCSDSANVGIFLLDEVLAYNPNFDYHINKPWTTTLIKDFHGLIYFRIFRDYCYDKRSGRKFCEKSLEIKGRGNVNFTTQQTSF